MSQGQLARQLGLTFSQIQKYEKGQNRVGAGRLYLISQKLMVSLDFFYEALEAGSCTEDENAVFALNNPEVQALSDAFISIENHDTRQSVLELVRSLGQKADPVPGARGCDAERGSVDGHAAGRPPAKRRGVRN